MEIAVLELLRMKREQDEMNARIQNCDHDLKFNGKWYDCTKCEHRVHCHAVEMKVHSHAIDIKRCHYHVTFDPLKQGIVVL